MPSETFYKLSEEKRNNILNAIKREFSRVPFEYISVNRIVEECKIAKGSFYQYFIDKEEAITYILKEFITVKKNEIKNVISENDGDIFKTAITVFEDIVSNTQNTQDMKFIKNAVHGIASKGINLVDIREETCSAACDKDMLKSIDISKYRINDEIELKSLLELVVRTLGAAVISILNNGDEYINIKKELIIQLNIIKRGVIKEGNIC